MEDIKTLDFQMENVMKGFSNLVGKTFWFVKKNEYVKEYESYLFAKYEKIEVIELRPQEMEIVVDITNEYGNEHHTYSFIAFCNMFKKFNLSLEEARTILSKEYEIEYSVLTNDQIYTKKAIDRIINRFPKVENYVDNRMKKIY